MVLVPGTILGGLPIMAEINCGWSAETHVSPGEFYSEVETIYWQKRDGTPGKEIPDHLYERAEAYDSFFAELIERGFDWLAQREHQENEMVPFETREVT